MELIELMRFSTPVLVLGLVVMLERINTTVGAIREDISEIKKGMIWQDTCDARHDEINRRLSGLEQK